MSKIHIAIAYALPKRHFLKYYDLPADSTVEDALQQSNLLQRFPEIDLAQSRLGIFSRPVKLSDPLKDGDRIEIYRPLLADPKEIRRQRAEQQREKERQEKRNAKLQQQIERTAKKAL